MLLLQSVTMTNALARTKLKPNAYTLRHTESPSKGKHLTRQGLTGPILPNGAIITLGHMRCYLTFLIVAKGKNSRA